MERSLFVGIDVAKDSLDVHARPTDETWQVPNDGGGHETLRQRFATMPEVLIAVEATGGYEVPVVAALAGAGVAVVVANPRQIRAYARATGQLAKTDKLDARIIALFAEAVRPEVRPLPTAETRALDEMVTRRRQLVEMLGAEKNRRRVVRDRTLQQRLEAHISWLTRALRELPKVALIAAMRKLLTILNAMVRDGRAWQEQIA
jgi:transposase